MEDAVPVLVVDDSPSIRAVLESYLRRLGYTDVRSAGSVKEALEVFRAQGSRLVFLDLLIGEESGLDFAETALAERPFTTIVVVTALDRDHDDVVAAFAEGAQEYLHKPVRFPALKQALDHLARLAREEASHGKREEAHHEFA